MRSHISLSQIIKAVFLFWICMLGENKDGSLYAQTFQKKDSLPNLWVIVIDGSGSMMPAWGRPRMSSYKTRVTDFLIKEFRDTLFNKAEVYFPKDKFVFFNSGIITRDKGKNSPSLAQVDATDPCCIPQYDICLSWIDDSAAWEDSYIHTYEFLDSLVYQFPDHKSFDNHLENIVRSGLYSFQYSFVALIRLFSLKRALKELSEQLFDINRLYFVVVSDFKDHNDQWNLDYKYLQECTEEKFRSTVLAFNEYETNLFNKESLELGGFEQYHTSKTPGREVSDWNLNFYEYATAAGREHIVNSDSLLPLKLEIVNDSLLHVKSNSLLGDDSIEFVSLRSISINERSLDSTFTWADEALIPFRIPRGTDSLFISLSGEIQTIYQDELLGKRRRIYSFNDYSFNIDSPFAPKSYTWLIITGIILSSLGIAYVAYKLYLNKTIINIYDTRGNVFNLKRGLLTQRNKNKILQYSPYPSSDIYFTTKYFKHKNKQEPKNEALLVIYISSRAKLHFGYSQPFTVQAILKENSVKDLYKEPDLRDDFIQSWKSKKENLYKVSFGDFPLTPTRSFGFRYRKKETVVSIHFVNEDPSDNNENHYLMPVLKTHFLSQRKLSDSIIYIDDAGESIRWSILLSNPAIQQLNQVEWKIDYTQSFSTNLNPSEKSKILTGLLKDLMQVVSLGSPAVYYKGPIEEIKKGLPNYIYPIENVEGKLIVEISKKILPGFLIASEDIIVNQSTDIKKAAKRLIYAPIQPIGKFPNVTDIPDGYTSMEKVGIYRLYISLFPSLVVSTKYEGTHHEVEGEQFRILSAKTAHYKIYRSDADGNVYIDFFDRSGIRTNYQG